MATNAKILGAVLNKWAQPLIGTFINSQVQSFTFVQGLENKVRSFGWVSPKWSLIGELSPLMESITGNMVAPIIERYLSNVDDASIPKLAHSIIDDALKKGEFRILEGKVTFELDDLRRLKRLLELNLPNYEEEIILKTE